MILLCFYRSANLSDRDIGIRVVEYHETLYTYAVPEGVTSMSIYQYFVRCHENRLYRQQIKILQLGEILF